MHRQTLRMSLALARNVRAVFRRPMHARDAEQRSGRRRTAPVRIQQVCERERRPPANQADGAARTHALGLAWPSRVRRLIRNVDHIRKMSYFTRVEFLFEDEVPDFEAFAECVRAHFDAKQYGVDDIISELRRGLEEGSAEFNRLESSDIEGLMSRISARFPEVRFCVRGSGEEWRDLWIREFAGGRVTFRSGPFLDGQKAAFFRYYFGDGRVA
jgi:hypothetical protein